MLPLLKPSCSEAEIAAVTEVLRSGWWGLGKVTGQFEEEFAAYVGAKYAVAVNSCTAALHLAVRTLDRKGVVITSPMTFVSTGLAALYENCTVHFSDIREDDLTLDRERVLEDIEVCGLDPIAIIPVHYSGYLASTDYDGIPVIEDCAHAVGTRTAGRHGRVACWSFHAVKHIATADGGMITTDDADLAARLRRLRWCGISSSTWEREKGGYNWEYQIDEPGFKYHLNDILSAIGRAQLARIDSLLEARRRLARRYTEAFRALDLPVQLPPESDSWHLYVIRVEAALRNPLIDYLKERGLSLGVHYKPLHLYPIFASNADLPVTDRVWPTLVDLPMFPDLAAVDQERVIDAIAEFFRSAPRRI